MRLGLFLSAGGSLAAWQRAGLLSREMALYRAYLETGTFERVTIFGYDGEDRAWLARQVAAGDPLAGQIDMIAPRRGRGGPLWSILGVLRHRRALKRCAVLKTNQTSGAWAALLASLVARRPLVYRQGYVLSHRLAHTGNRLKAAVARLVEGATARRAQAIVVSGEGVARRYARGQAANKLAVVPSFVDLASFAPKTDYAFDGPVIAVGRLHPNKNLVALIEACAACDVPLTLVGTGPQRDELEAAAAACGAELRLTGQVDNADLPALLRDHAIFVLPSFIEGLPKVLIEAMACGLVCIGSAIPGIVELIEDGRTGYLIPDFDSASIAAQIRRARAAADPAIGRAARAAIAERFGLAAYVAQEGAILHAAAQR